LEWKRFGRFVHSPYHNTNDQLKVLYTLLKKAFPFEILKDLEQERIYKKVYGKESFKLSKFQNLCSDLYELATDFIVDVHLSKEKWKKKKVVIDALSERNYELFKGASQQLIKEVEEQEYFLDNNDFLLLYQLYDSLHHHLDTGKYTNDQIYFDKIGENLVAFYEDGYAQLSAENTGQNNFLNKNKEELPSKRSQMKDLFQLAIALHENKQIAIYFQLKEKVLASWSKLKTKHKIDLFLHLLNFSFTNELIQKEFGFKESFQLYKIGIKHQLFIFNEKMRDVEFVNIGMLGFGFKEYEWTEAFINDHRQYISEELRHFLIPFLYAYKAISLKDYEKVIELLAPINPVNKILYLPKIKGLLIRAYYEGLISGEEHYRSPLNYEIESLNKMMIRTDKISEIKAKSYTNFLNLIKHIMKIREIKNYDLNQVLALEIELKKTSPLILQKWLIEKLEELKNTAS